MARLLWKFLYDPLVVSNSNILTENLGLFPEVLQMTARILLFLCHSNDIISIPDRAEGGYVFLEGISKNCRIDSPILFPTFFSDIAIMMFLLGNQEKFLILSLIGCLNPCESYKIKQILYWNNSHFRTFIDNKNIFLQSAKIITIS